MSMSSDGKKETTKVDCGVILSGQEMPTVDIALFSRTIYLTFSTTIYSREAKQKFNNLALLRKQGMSHLTNEILRQRTIVEGGFSKAYDEAMTDLAQDISANDIEDRIWRDWATLLAMYRLLRAELHLPWSYDAMKAITAEGIKRQNNECAASNELGSFWGMLDYLCRNGQIVEERDFRVAKVGRLKIDGCADEKVFKTEKKILMLRPRCIIMEYKKAAKQTDERAMSSDSIRFYLKTSPGYIGRKSGPARFKNIVNGVWITKTVFRAGVQKTEQDYITDNPLCFDYEVLREKYGVNLETFAEEDAERVERGEQPLGQQAEDNELPF